MTGVFQILFCFLGVILFSGCVHPEQDDTKALEGVKIGDLAPPAGSIDKPQFERLKTIDFDIYVVEIPVKKIADFNSICQKLSMEAIRFTNYDIFKSNCFAAGFGAPMQWDPTTNKLRNAGCKIGETISLLLSNGQASDVAITDLRAKQDIFYVSGSGGIEGVTLGPGNLAIRIRAVKAYNSSRVCSVDIQPVFATSASNPLLDTIYRRKNHGFVFVPLGIKSKMRTGDFILIGPEQYTADQTTLGGLFFYKAAKTPMLKAYLIVCKHITD